jgi:acyl-CoA synthetase (AMP-forming)/AMP-acid ligase II
MTAEFEIVEEDVLGTTLPVFAHRKRQIGEILASGAERFAERPFLVSPDDQLTFAEFDVRARRVAAHLIDGCVLKHGDRVAIAGANSPSYAVLFWAVALAGGINVGLNGWWSGPELRHGIDVTEPLLLLADEPRRRRLVDAGVDDSSIHGIDEFVRAVGERGRVAALDTSIDEDDPLLILFTSGTTGRAKGAILSHRNFIHHADVIAMQTAVRAAEMGVDASSLPLGVSICASPFFHVSGALPLITAPGTGLTQVLAAPGRWDEVEHLRLTEQFGVTHWAGVSTQFWRIFEHPRFEEFDVSTVRGAGGGGATFAPELQRLFADKLPGAVLGTGYGLSESAGMGVSISGDLLRRNPTSIGTVQATSEVEIRDEQDRPLPEGEIGEICLRHAGVFLGYWGDPEATAAALTEDRFLRTGDFGRIVDGLVYLESRIRDMIIRGGENIYPIEIENRLVEHPEIDQAAVVGVGHQVLGQEVKAFVVPKVAGTLDAAAVQRWVAGALAAFKVPADVEFRDSLPLTASGKVMKHLLVSDVSDVSES